MLEEGPAPCKQLRVNPSESREGNAAPGNWVSQMFLRQQIIKGLQVGLQSSGEEPSSHQVPPLKTAELGVLTRPTAPLSRS